jgi:hypothetical protein
LTSLVIANRISTIRNNHWFTLSNYRTSFYCKKAVEESSALVLHAIDWIFPILALFFWAVQFTKAGKLCPSALTFWQILTYHLSLELPETVLFLYSLTQNATIHSKKPNRNGSQSRHR